MDKSIDEKLYTAGEVAKLTNVTIRTIRYYDNIKLLNPSKYGIMGTRLYNSKDIMKLQEILTLKLIGFSLKEISEIVDGSSKNTFYETLNTQEKALKEKIGQINKVIDLISDAKRTLGDKENDWNKFTNIIKAIKATEISVNQYKTLGNLTKRISLHEEFSTNKEIGWYEWCYQKMNFNKNKKILEVGCGNARLWKKNMEKIDRSLDITLTDIETKMVEESKKELQEKLELFHFDVVDVCKLPYEDSSFDSVIANHMLYHVKDIEKSLIEIYRVLKKGGTVYISTVGKDHLKELKDIIEKVDLGKTREQWSFIDRFNLETGFDYLEKIFTDVYRYNYEDNLLVDKVEPILTYVNSMENPNNIIFKGKKLNELKKKLEDEIRNNNGMFIRKETGILVAKK